MHAMCDLFVVKFKFSLKKASRIADALCLLTDIYTTYNIFYFMIINLVYVCCFLRVLPLLQTLLLLGLLCQSFVGSIDN